MESRALLIHPEDNVAVALEDIAAGASVKVSGPKPSAITAREMIPFAHKIATRRVSRGEAITKFGVPIGFATEDISEGEWVHYHNVKSYFVARREEQSR
jgi:altronate hydrolase